MAKGAGGDVPENLTDVLLGMLAAVQSQLAAVEILLRQAQLGEAPRTELPAGADATPLTPRELEVLRLLGRGASNRIIGRELGISDHTVRSHLQAVFRKLGVAHRTQAVTAALQYGLIDPYSDAAEESGQGGASDSAMPKY
ncbi:response regulator transcription factor [Streptomyces monticola]|uniref:Response regulator transcription factor n=1 Tax=Streptomyces monticola TaxID=2666263 RepID=A0ABW2JXV4_9ACTN